MLHNKTAACLALAAAVQAHESRLTVGTVQREVRVGMSGAEVAQVLGSPNIVSTDEQRRQVWIYDKIATDRAYSTSSGGINSLILGAATSALGGLGGAFMPHRVPHPPASAPSLSSSNSTKPARCATLPTTHRGSEHEEKIPRPLGRHRQRGFAHGLRHRAAQCLRRHP